MVDIEIPILHDHSQSPGVFFHGRGNSCTELLCVYRTALEKKLLLVTLFLSVTMVGLVIGIAIIHGESHAIKKAATPKMAVHSVSLIERSKEISVVNISSSLTSSTGKSSKIESGGVNVSPKPVIIMDQNDTNLAAVLPNTSTEEVITTTETPVPKRFSAIETSTTIPPSPNMTHRAYPKPAAISAVESLNVALDATKSNTEQSKVLTKVDVNSTEIS